jgi:ABC-2 type transport system ATP-binding protein
VEENLRHQGHLYGLRGAGLRQRIDELCRRFGLASRLRERTRTLSGGLRRRVEIAKALLHRPSVLLMDEPSTGLDPGARLEVWSHLDALSRENGVTVVFTTHLMDEAERCDRVALLDAGRIIASDKPQALTDLVGGEVVTVETLDPSRSAAAFGQAFGLRPVIVGSQVRMESRSGGELAREILDRWPDAVRGVRVSRPTLEDAFVHLTGRRLQEESPEGSGDVGGSAP